MTHYLKVGFNFASALAAVVAAVLGYRSATVSVRFDPEAKDEDGTYPAA